MVKKKVSKKTLLVLASVSVLIAIFVITNVAGWIDSYCDWRLNQLPKEFLNGIVYSKDMPDDWELKDRAEWTSRSHFERIKCETNPFFWNPNLNKV
jgi:hypothetical protein